MMNRLIWLALQNRAPVLVIAALFLAWGIHTAIRMPVDVFPDLTAPTVTILTEARGMAPVELESQLTVPIETALNGATGVRRVRSATSPGIAVVWVEFDWGTDIRDARQVVNERLAVVANDLPPEADRPVLAPVSSIMGEVLFLSIGSDRHTGMELRTAAETSVRRRLLAVPGISQVSPIGGEIKQFQIVISEEQLLSAPLTLPEIAEAVAADNQNVSAGFLPGRGSDWIVSGMGRFRSVEEIAQTVLFQTNGIPVRVGDVGTVRTGAAPKYGEASVNGLPAVILGIQKQPQANTLELTAALDRVLAEVSRTLPEGMTINPALFRQADFISVAVRNVLHALRDGALLVVLIMFAFLANARATFITVMAIPLSLVAAILILHAFGATVNTMTLGGMAIAMGALVDDAVIDVENVFRRLRENAALEPGRRRPILDVVFHASVEIRTSIFFATMIIVLVFLPLLFLSGVEGRLMQPLGLAYIVALLASLLVAITVTPVLCYFLLPGSKAVRRGTEPRLVRFLKRRYNPLLQWALRNPWKTVVPSMGLLILAAASFPFMGKAFLPEFNEGSLTISAVTLPGASLEESDKLGKMIEETLLEFPEVLSVGRRTGRAELDEHVQGPESSELDVMLRMQDRGKAEFLEAIRRELALVPGVNISIGQPISHRIDHMLSGTRANVAVKIFGDHLGTLRAIAERARRSMEEIPGVVDLSVEQQVEIPALTVRYDREQMARLGLRSREVGQYLEAAVQGLTVSQVREGQSAFDLVLKLGGSETRTPESLGGLTIPTAGGARVPLETIATIRKETTPNLISREQVQRKIVVMCNVAGRDVASVVNDVMRSVDPIVAAFPEYRVEYGGQFESATESRRVLIGLGIVVVMGIGLLLALAFSSFRDAALVMINLPLALIGGAAGVFVSGGVLSIASLIGFIAVFGIATRNGIMLVSHIRHLQLKEGVHALDEAVRRGAMERLAPILMTALATALALIPLALGGDKPGSQIQTPMAIVILFGLLSSMTLNMLIVPALYLRFGRPAAPPSQNADSPMTH